MTVKQNDITKLKVMTYNVQWFSKINSQLAMQEKILNKHNAHIVGLQELSVDGKINSVGQEALAGYPYKFMSKHKNFMGFASKHKLKNVRSHEFTFQDPEDMARYGETRAYMTGTLELDGKAITVINTHLCYLTQSIKFKQMRQIFRRAEKSEYVVITGDFNCFDGESERMYGKFIDAGYHLANCDPKVTKTWTDKTAPKRLSQFTFPTDNIITSGNIEIRKIAFDKTKLSYEDGNPIDHIPMVATLWIH